MCVWFVCVVCVCVWVGVWCVCVGVCGVCMCVYVCKLNKANPEKKFLTDNKSQRFETVILAT